MSAPPIVVAFEEALADPERAQRRALARLLDRNAQTAYGRDHDFAGATTYERFCERVPVVSYGDLERYIERVIGGEPAVLIADPVVYLATSSGTTGRKKYVPIHRGFAAETDDWMALERHYLERAHPHMIGARELRYVNRIEGRLPLGIPIGAVSAWYYGVQVEEGRYQELVPYEVYQLEAVRARNYAILRLALAEDVAQMSAVNPSTLLLLAQVLREDAAGLIRDLRDGGVHHPEIPAELASALSSRLPANPSRAQELEHALATSGKLTPRAAWPNLRLVACWIHAGAGLYRSDLLEAFGAVDVWDYGYTSTEGRVTVTATPDGAGVPLVLTVFLELRKDDGSIVPIFSAKDDDEGELLVTNSRGLYRYAMGDVVQVAGRLARTPLLRFRRKTTAVASLTGEKLSEEQVVRVVETLLKEHQLRASYFCLAPIWGTPPHYVLLLDIHDDPVDAALGEKLVAGLERGLVAANAEYERKRSTLRLGAPEILVLAPGELDAYRGRLARAGRELARLKLPRVSMDLDLAKSFRGSAFPSNKSRGKTGQDVP